MKPGAALPLVLITLGLLWFLKSSNLLPDTTTLLAILLAISGVVLLLLDGITKSSIVSSPMLVYAGACVYLLDEDVLRLSHGLSLGMVLLGILMLIARSDRIPLQRRRPPLAENEPDRY